MEQKNIIAGWEILFQEHRGEEMAVILLECLRIGLRDGQITSDSVRHIPVINGSVRGACFRNLRRGGMFEKVGFTASKADGRNGSAIAIWKLTRPIEARMILDKVADHFCGCTKRNGKEEQVCFC